MKHLTLKLFFVDFSKKYPHGYFPTSLLLEIRALKLYYGIIVRMVDSLLEPDMRDSLSSEERQSVSDIAAMLLQKQQFR